MGKAACALTFRQEQVLHKHLDHYGMLPIQCRIRCMTMTSRLRRNSVAKRYAKDTANQMRMGRFQERRSTTYTSGATRRMYRRAELAEV